MSTVAVYGAIQQGLLYALVAFGIFVSFRVLNTADLTVEGSFTLGAAVSASFTLQGRPLTGLLLAALAGFLAGCVTGLLQTKLKVPAILSGILTMTALYSINLRVMGGRPNLSLLTSDTVFTAASALLPERLALTVLPFGVVALATLALSLFFRTQLGLSVRATGDNEAMVKSSSIDAAFTRTLGLGLANSCVALSGGLLAQYQGFAEVNMGVGIVVIGLASLVIGEAVLGRRSILRSLVAVTLGAVAYRLIWAFVLARGFPVSDMRLVAAVVVGIAISAPATYQSAVSHLRRRRAHQNAQAS